MTLPTGFTNDFPSGKLVGKITNGNHIIKGLCNPLQVKVCCQGAKLQLWGCGDAVMIVDWL